MSQTGTAMRWRLTRIRGLAPTKACERNHCLLGWSVEPLHVVDGKQFLTRSVPLRSFLIGSKLHFKQGHRLQCPGIIFTLLRAPKDALGNVLHPRRTHRMRQRGYRSRQRFIHRRNQIGRERGIRKIFHPVRPVRGSWGACVDTTCWPAACSQPASDRGTNHARRPLYRVVRRCQPIRRAKPRPIRNKIDLADPAQIRPRFENQHIPNQI